MLKPEVARDLGVVGIAGRASGFDHDLRRDFPHAAYDQLKVTVPVYQAGDVEHRMQVRIDEVRESFSLIEQFVAKLPGGPVRVEIGELPAGATALGYVEGWRGEIFHWIRTAPGNRLARCKVKDPSLQNWPALSEAILGNIIPDFPVVNKSFNLSILEPTVMMIMFGILGKSLSTGVVTENYPATPPEISRARAANRKLTGRTGRMPDPRRRFARPARFRITTRTASASPSLIWPVASSADFAPRWTRPFA